MNKLFIVLLIGIFMFGFASAVGCDSEGWLGTGEVGQNFTVAVSCPSCTFLNFSLVSPSKNKILNNVPMTQIGNSFEYNVSGSIIDKPGTYFGEGGDDSSPLGFCFDITTSGFESTLNESMFYLASIIILIFFIIMMILISSQLPGDDTRDEEGRIIQISWLKHLRPMLWAVCYVFMVAIVFIMQNLTLGYSNHDMLSTFFFMLFQVMFWIMIICLPLWFIWIFVRFFEDKEFKRMLERGVDLHKL